MGSPSFGGWRPLGAGVVSSGRESLGPAAVTGRGEPDGAATIEEQYRAACAAIDASYEAHLKMLREFRENPFADDPLWWYKLCG